MDDIYPFSIRYLSFWDPILYLSFLGFQKWILSITGFKFGSISMTPSRPISLTKSRHKVPSHMQYILCFQMSFLPTYNSHHCLKPRISKQNIYVMQKNNSEDGVFEVMTGADSVYDVGKLISFQVNNLSFALFVKKHYVCLSVSV